MCWLAIGLGSWQNHYRRVSGLLAQASILRLWASARLTWWAARMYGNPAEDRSDLILRAQG